MKRRINWLKISVILVMAMIVIGAGLWGVSTVMLRRVPEWYQPDTTTAEQRNKGFNEVVRVLEQFSNWGQRHHAAVVNATLKPDTSATSRQAQLVLDSKPDEAFQISFTDDQLNAFFNAWADNNHARREWIEQYVEDPRLVLRENQLILVGKVKDQGVIVSLVFEPKLTDKGEINLNLTHVLGGVLPIPDAAWANQRNSIEGAMRRKLPIYQAGANINGDGVANGDAGSAAMNLLITAMLQYKPTPAVIFIPMNGVLSQSLPVKITAFVIHDHTLNMTAEQMSEPDRAAFLKQLKTPEENAE